MRVFVVYNRREPEPSSANLAVPKSKMQSTKSISSSGKVHQILIGLGSMQCVVVVVCLRELTRRRKRRIEEGKCWSRNTLYLYLIIILIFIWLCTYEHASGFVFNYHFLSITSKLWLLLLLLHLKIPLHDLQYAPTAFDNSYEIKIYTFFGDCAQNEFVHTCSFVWAQPWVLLDLWINWRNTFPGWFLCVISRFVWNKSVVRARDSKRARDSPTLNIICNFLFASN